MNLTNIATDFFNEGLNPLPLKKNKAPNLPKDHKLLYEFISENELDNYFINTEKIGIACGKVSNGFYAVDFDCHGGEDVQSIFNDFCKEPLINFLFETGKLSAYSTMGGGFHIYFKCNELIKGKVFAKYSTAGTMIELRGDGQYVACYPSDGYKHIKGVEFIKLSHLEEQEEIINICKSFNQYEKLNVSKNSEHKGIWASTWKDTTPDGKYNLECGDEAKQLLIDRGWKYVFTRNDGVDYWVRPGKKEEDGTSATWGFQSNLFYVFSSGEGVIPFEEGGRYSPFNILTLLKFGGDWKVAKDHLRKRFGMENNDEFWSQNEKGSYSLNNFKFKRFLEENDYFKSSPNNLSTFDFIKKDSIFLKIVYEKDIKDFVLNFIETNDLGEGVYNLMTGNLKFFKRDYLSLVPTKPIKTLKDTKDICYLFYKNCIVEVTSEGRKKIPYKEMELSIWQDQLIDREYSESDHHKGEYRKFIWKISGENKDKYLAFQTVIGYLLHSFKNNSNNKAIIFNDEIISENPNGRSGKGLFWNALKHLKKVQSLDGKTFDFKKSFPYQNVSTDCQVLVFDDVKKNFDFENLFSIITEGITIEYKGKDSIKLDVTESPKIVITTNYTIKGDSASHNARKYEAEMSSYFNENHTPIHEFGHELFNDWDGVEWAKFDNYMMECLQKYLKHGLIEMPTINLKTRKLINEVGSELLQFFDTLNFNEWYDTKSLYSMFCTHFPEKSRFVTQYKITTSIKKWAKHKDLELLNPTSGGVSKVYIGSNTTEIKDDNEMPF